MNIFTSQETKALTEFFALDLPGVIEQIPLANHVAQLALSAIQARLPQVGFVDAEGTISTGRQHFDVLRRPVVMLPQFLCSINWADTAPGISWPEAYHVTYLPGVDRYVVTASQDSPDAWGVTELAIGSFAAYENIRTGSAKVITNWWQYQLVHGDQEHWAYVLETGLISRAAAAEWAEQVWGITEDCSDDPMLPAMNGLEEALLEMAKKFGAPTPQPQEPRPVPFYTELSEQDLASSPRGQCGTPFLRANEAREAQGLPPLTWDDWLRQSPDSK